MDISRYNLFLYQDIAKVLERFYLSESKYVVLPLANHFKLSLEQSLKNKEEAQIILNVPHLGLLYMLRYALDIILVIL